VADGAALRLERVSIALGARVLLGIDALVRPGAVLSVMGPSGSGKSTLLAFVAGFLDAAFTASGRVLIGAEDITKAPPQRRRAGLLFPDALLFPHMSVMGNLLFAIPPSAGPKRVRAALAQTALARMGLDGFGPRDPFTLSSGQKARVALARVLLSRPRLLLLDEPFSRLDAGLRSEIRALVFAEARAEDLPVLLVTHDEADAQAAGGPVHRLDA
jgi:putative thiamine transport system ATP-binding protein